MKRTVVAHVNSKSPRITQDLLGQVHVYVSEPPLEGKANKAIIRALAEYYGVTKSSVRIVSGEHSKTKLIEVEGVEEDK